MLEIYHNPRCSKSRQGVEFLKNKNLEFKVIDYLKEGISENEICELLKKLNISASDLVRKNETIWKDNYKGKDLSEKQIIKILSENPKLIERPIIVNKSKAVIGRPTEKIEDIL